MSVLDAARLRSAAAAAFLAAFAGAHPARAQESVVSYKSIAPDIAFEIAHAALKKCRDDGLQVAVVVLDRFGQTVILLRDRFAGLPAAGTASSKAYTSLSFRMSTARFVEGVEARRLSPELGRLPNIVMLAGGLPIESGGIMIGAIGVSGAPGGDKDEACAQAGVDAAQEKLDF